MKLAQVRRHALSLPEVTEEPHFNYSSFRVRGKIFVTVPPEGTHVHVFVGEAQRESALAVHPGFLDKLSWGAKVVGLRVTLDSAEASVVHRLVSSAWQRKAPKSLAGAPPLTRAPRFVALLRGVNVGKAKRVPMAELRLLLSGLGYANVATLLNSGNAVFNAPGGTSTHHAGAIAAAIAAQLKVEVPVIVKSATEFAAIVAQNPIPAEETQHSRFLVAFVQAPKALPSLATIASLALPPERFVVGKNAAYLLCPAGILESKAGAALLGRAGQSGTTRNWATVLKLQAWLEAPDA